MNGTQWLRKRVRVYSGTDRAKGYRPMAEGEVIGYIDGPSIIVQADDGHQSAWPVSLPIDACDPPNVTNASLWSS